MKSLKKVLFGIFLLVAAAAVILAALGILPNVGVWPTILTVVLACLAIGGICDRSFFMIIMPLAVIAVIYAEPLGISKITPWPLLVACFLVSVALSIIFPSFGKKKGLKFNVNYNGNDGDFKSSTVSNSGSYDMTEVNFGEQTKYFNSDDFMKADLECNFGTIKAYFVDAQLHENQATVNAECNFGSIEIYVPKTWTVNVNDNGAFHGVDEKGMKAPDGINTLIVNSETNFGGLVIHYV